MYLYVHVHVLSLLLCREEVVLHLKQEISILTAEAEKSHEQVHVYKPLEHIIILQADEAYSAKTCPIHCVT